MTSENLTGTLREKAVFVKAVELGSLVKTARALGMEDSAAAKAINTLEAREKRKLLIRDPKGSRPTAEGWKAFNLWRGPIAELLGAMKGDDDASPWRTWQLNLAFPSTSGAAVLTPLVAEFALEHPEYDISIELTHGSFHPLWNGVDLRIVHGVYTLEPCRQAQIASLKRIVTANPKLLPRLFSGKEIEPEELLNEMLVGDRDMVQSGVMRLIRNSDGFEKRLRVEPRLKVRNHLAAMMTALANPVVAVAVPVLLAKRWIDAGDLAPVLPGWRCRPLPLRAIIPQDRPVHPAIPGLLEHIVGRLRESGEAEDAAIPKSFAAFFEEEEK